MLDIASILRAALLEARLPLNLTSRLPTEVLAEIFGQIPGNAFDDFDESREDCSECADKSSLIKAADVLPLTHVCRRWRQIATGIRGLWTTVDDRKQMPFTIHVERSRGLPLDVIINGEPTNYVLSCLRNHGDAVRQLHWAGMSAVRYDCKFDLMLPLPNLQIATLLSTRTADDNEELSLFGNTSSLRRLCFRWVDWLPKNHFPHLTQLHVAHWTGDPDTSVFLAFLRQCPNLIDVFIWSLFADEPSPAPDADFVELPRLRRLSFQEFVQDEILHILSHIRAPSDTALAVLGGITDDDMLMGIGDEDARAVSRFCSISACTTAVIRVGDDGSSSMAFLRQTAGVYIENLLSAGSGFIPLPPPLPLGQVQELWILDDPMIMPGSHPQATLNADVFRRLPAVRRLVVTVGLIHAVHLAIHTLAEDARPPITAFEILVNTQSFAGHFPNCVASLIKMGVPHPMITIPSGLPSTRERILGMDGIDSMKCVTCEQLPIPALPEVCAEHSNLQPSWKTLVTPVCELENGLSASLPTYSIY